MYTREEKSLARSYDAIIIGGGHNGLVCAAYLARAGKSVLVLERRDILGGATVTEEIYPGFKYTVCSYVVSLLRPQIISDLNLPKFGLELLPLDGTMTPMPNGDHLMRWHDSADTRLELMRHSAKDAEAYEEFGRLMHHLAMTIRPMLSTIPPDPFSLSPSNIADLARLGGKFAERGEHLYDLAKLMTMSSADLLEQWFETPVLQGTLGASGIIGTFLGPRSPGSAYVMMHHYMGEIDGQFRAWGLPRGGMSGVVNAIADSARYHGAEIRTDAPVSEILIKNGRATGVVLEDGEEIKAPMVASSADPKITFQKLVDQSHLEEDFKASIDRFKIRGSSGKVNLSLDALPEFDCLANIGVVGKDAVPYLSGAISISPDLEYLERAYDDAKYGNFSRHPYMDIVIPSLIDPSMAPAGKHVMSCFVQYAPYDLAKGTWDDQREAFGDAVVNTIAQYAPNFKSTILHRQIMTPLDLERRIGLTNGNIFHGELSLEQLFFLRPVPGYGRFGTPVKDLYLCGSGAHPGGGVMGAPGKLAADIMLEASL